VYENGYGQNIDLLANYGILFEDITLFTEDRTTMVNEIIYRKRPMLELSSPTTGENTDGFWCHEINENQRYAKFILAMAYEAKRKAISKERSDAEETQIPDIIFCGSALKDCSSQHNETDIY
jgi:hypothetical protein